MKTFNYKQTLLSMKKFYTITMCALAAFMFISVTTVAQSTWNGAAGGLWSAPGNWTPVGVPAAGTTVTIPNSATKTSLVVDVPTTCAGITISSGANTFTLTVNNGQSLTVNGTLSIGGPTAANIVKSVVLATSTSTLTATDIVLTDVVGGNANTNAALNIGAGTATVSGNVTMNGNVTSENRITIASGGKLTIGGTLSPANGTVTLNTGSYVEYNAAGAQVMRAMTYSNLIVSGSGSKSAAVTVNDSLLVNGTATLGTAVTYSSAVLAYKGTSAQTVGANEFPTPMTTPVVIDNTGGVTIGSAKTLNNDLTILSGTLAAGTNLTMGVGFAINMSGGSITGTLQSNNAYDVNYSGGSFSTSAELSGTGLRNVDVTQTNTTDVVTLSQSWAPDGTVNLGNGVLDIGGFTFNHSTPGGTFNVTGGSTLRIGGTNGLPTNYNYSISNSTGTVDFNGTNQTVGVPPGDNYTILILSGSGTKTISAGNTVSSLLSIQGTGVIVAGTIPTYNAAAVLEYKGTGAQTTGIEFGGTGANPANLTIDNAAGVTLSAAKLLNGILDLTSGYLTTTNTNLLTLGKAATVPTPAGYIDGPLAKNMPSGIGGTFTFPVGKVGRGIARNAGIITTTTGTATFQAEFFNANPKTTFSASLGAIDQISNCEYWDVTRTTGTATSRVILSWPVPANNCGSTDWGYVGNTTSLIVAHFTGGVWVNEGRLSTTGSPAAGGTITCNTPLTTYSPFTLGTTNGLQNPLPVKFANVKAFQKNAGVQVEWTNLTEKDVTRYVVERSSNGVSFSPVAEVLARGNQSNAEQYASFDANPVSGTNYYRVTAIEITGKTIYSNIMKVDMGQQDKVLSLYPNPVKNHQVNFTFSSQRGAYSINVYNSNGQVVFSKMLQHDGGAITQMIELPASVKTGVYNLKVSGDGFSSSKPFIVQ